MADYLFRSIRCHLHYSNPRLKECRNQRSKTGDNQGAIPSFPNCGIHVLLSTGPIGKAPFDSDEKSHGSLLYFGPKESGPLPSGNVHSTDTSFSVPIRTSVAAQTSASIRL